MKMIKLFITVIVFSALWLNSYSQFRKNAVVLDIAGKAFSIYDLSYERYLTEKLHFGAGRIIFRVPVYLTYVGQNAWWPSVLPWAGLSIGMPF